MCDSTPFKHKIKGRSRRLCLWGKKEAGIHRSRLSSSSLLPIVAHSLTERKSFVKDPGLLAHTQRIC